MGRTLCDAFCRLLYGTDRRVMADCAYIISTAQKKLWGGNDPSLIQIVTGSGYDKVLFAFGGRRLNERKRNEPEKAVPLAACEFLEFQQDDDVR
jgi:hypothetical protein